MKFLILLTLLSTTACTPPSNYRNLDTDVVYVDKIPASPTNVSLSGQWESACDAVMDPATSIISFKKRFLSVTASQEFSVTTKHYTSGCDEAENFKTISQGTLEVFLSDISVQDVNFTFHETSLVITKAESVDGYNLKDLCGINNWMVNEEQDITGVDCLRVDGMRNGLASGTINYNLFLISNNELQLGDSTLRLALSEEARPAQLDLASFVRINP